MAELLRLIESWLSRILKVASLPDTVAACFIRLEDIPVKPAYPLAVMCSDADQRSIVIDRAHRLSDQKVARGKKGQSRMGGAEIIRQLMQGLEGDKILSPAPLTIESNLGRPMVSLGGRVLQ